MSDKIVFAVPKGRILKEVMPLFKKCGIKPEADFFNDDSRALQFKTNIPNLELVRVRAFDVATFVAFGAAQLGVVGNDVLEEFAYSEIYAPVNLKIGACRLSVAMQEDETSLQDPTQWSHIRVATKYPHLTAKHFRARGVQTECIKLNGAMEIAPKLGIARRIVDLVSSGATLKANGLTEIEKILDVSSYLVVNRTALKTRSAEMKDWITKFRSAVA
jgi:ATP phosphoribosyltransferase